MKKIFMTLAAAFVAVSMNAQVYVGGSLGFASVSPEVGDGETTFTLLPEIGYQFSEDWAVGVQVGYASDKVMGVGYVGDLSQWVAVGPSESAFIFAPYARYTALKYKCVNLFFDGGIGFVSGSDAKFSAMNIGIKPGVAINLNEKLSFVSHFGFVGYETVNPDGDDNNRSAFGLGLNGNSLTFGLYYNF